MKENYNIAVIGDRESVMGFRAIGLDVYPVLSAEEAKKTIHTLAENDTAIIYITEQIAKDIPDVISRYSKLLTPAVILIPGKEGTLGIGKTTMESAMQRAIGADIL